LPIALVKFIQIILGSENPDPSGLPPKSNRLGPGVIQPSVKFREDLISSFSIIVLTDKQTRIETRVKTAPSWRR